MSDRRPARARKAVDYAKFGGPDDFDDDFADLTPPPSKKAKTSSSKDLQKKTTAITDKKKPTKRTPLAEKVYERELQAALELSLIASQSSNCDDDDEDFKPKNNKKSNVIKIEKEKINKTPVTSTPFEEVKQNDVICSVEVNKDKNINCINIERLGNSSEKTETVHAEHNVENHKILHEIQRNKSDGNDSDSIIVLEDEEELGKGGRRKSVIKAKVVYDDSEDNESEFSVDEDDDDDDPSDDDYDEDNDSDFDCGSKKKKKDANKKTVTPKPTKQTKTNVGTKPAAASKPGADSKAKTIMPVVSSKGPLKSPAITVRAAVKSPAITARPAVKSPAIRSAISSPIVRTVPKWNPPGSAENVNSPLGSASIQSPSSGGMRVGLSRNQRVKSLHPGLTLKTT
ncbi:RAD51-associated protein 1-like isoform X2 [Mytilus californianus]|uniref:RAD51-associated protein 1-like isoform X2 n=1 Tax=Mytilus californianus TaxID=6549 RepID=UPI002246D7B9|nr:RAD51-associated protein 1-like isoform X2 [Mytilus californianus]